MIVLDAYALVGLLAAEPAARQVASLLETRECAVSAVNLAEAADVLARTKGIDVRQTRAVIGPLTDGVLAVVHVDDARGWRAAELRARHYARRESEVSLADCVLLACAVPGRDAVATGDPSVLRIAALEGIDVVSLPESQEARQT